jgi:hypothetical protein
VSTALEDRQDRHTLQAPPTAPAHSQARMEWERVQHRYSSLRDVVFEETCQGLRLWGRVGSHYLKQVALAVICPFADARPILNEIRVEPVPLPVPRPPMTLNRYCFGPHPSGVAPGWGRSVLSRPDVDDEA